MAKKKGMPKLNMKRKTFKKGLLSLGFEKRNLGRSDPGTSHGVYFHPVTKATVTFPDHGRDDEIPIGLLKSLLKDAGIDEEELRKTGEFKFLDPVVAYQNGNGTAENGIYSRVEKTDVPNIAVETPKKTGGKNGRRK